MKPATVCHQHKASSLSLIVPFPSFRCDSKRTDRVDLQYIHEQELVRFERGLKQFQCMVSRTWDTWLKYTWMEEYIRLFLLIKDRRSCHFCRDPSPLFISLLILYIPDDIRGIRWKRARWPINSSWAGLGWAGLGAKQTALRFRVNRVSLSNTPWSVVTRSVVNVHMYEVRPTGFDL